MLLSYGDPPLFPQHAMWNPSLWPQSWGAAKQEASVPYACSNPLFAKGNSVLPGGHTGQSGRVCWECRQTRVRVTPLFVSTFPACP